MNRLLPVDVAVLGAGPGGYAAAFMASDLGLKTALIDPQAHPGGVCLYRGCIPSKALLHAAKIISESRDAASFGIKFPDPEIDLEKLKNWKNSIVEKLTSGLSSLTSKRNIQYIQGMGKFLNSSELEIKDLGILPFKKAIIATGSKPAHFPYAPLSDKIMDSTAALELKEIPESLLVVGGGYIGIELGSVYARLGSKVTIIDSADRLLINVDRDLVNILERKQKDLFEEILLSVQVEKLSESENGADAVIVLKDGSERRMHFKKILSAIGRRPHSEFLGLENTSVKTNEKGFIFSGPSMQTSDKNIYAIGDITGGPMLAHVASYQGKIAAEAIAGKNVIFAPRAIPAVIYSDPQIAWCGITQKEATAEMEILRFPWGASGRSLTMNRSDGMTKLIVDKTSKRILGMGIVGPDAGEMIAEGVLAIEMGAVADDIGDSIFPHPTLSETVMETAESFFGMATHLYRPHRSETALKDII